MNVYALFDKVSKRYLALTFAESDDDYVRQALYPTLMDYPLRDVEYYQVAEFDNKTGVLSPCPHRLGSWEAYKFPVTRMSGTGDDISLDEIDKHAKESKASFVAQQSEMAEKVGHTEIKVG